MKTGSEGHKRRFGLHKDSLRLQVEVKRNRLKRHGPDIAREIGAGTLLLVAIAVVTSALLWGCDRLFRSSLFAVHETVVKGCNEITEKEVLSLAGISPGANLLTVNKEAIVRRISGNSWVKNAFVGREFPNRLVILVRERNAVALIEKENLLYLVDKNGEIFKKLGNDEKIDLPVLTGFFSGNVLNSKMIGKSLVLLNSLQGTKKLPEIGVISELHGNETFGFSVFTDRGLCLQFGFDGYETKLQTLARVIDDMTSKNLKNGFMLIDLSNPEKVNVQTRMAVPPGGSGIPAVKGRKLQM